MRLRGMNFHSTQKRCSRSLELCVHRFKRIGLRDDWRNCFRNGLTRAANCTCNAAECSPDETSNRAGQKIEHQQRCERPSRKTVEGTVRRLDFTRVRAISPTFSGRWRW